MAWVGGNACSEGSVAQPDKTISNTAGSGNRTRVASLGSWCTTTVLYPRRKRPIPLPMELFQGLFQLTGGGFGVGRGADGANHRDSRSTRLQHLRKIVPINPPDAKDRDRQRLRHAADAGRPDAAVVRLGRSRKDRPKPEVIRALRLRGERLLEAVGRFPDQAPCPEASAGHGDGRGILSEVHAVSADRASDRGSVI